MPAPASTPRTSKTPGKLFWALNGLLGIAFVVELSGASLSSAQDGVTIALAAVASVAALSRQLPLQNVLSAAFIAMLIGGIAHGASSNSNLSIPFGPIEFNPAVGAKIFNFVPWTIPLLWVIAIFNARGVARLILRPWRKVKNYGFRLVGLTTLLVVAFDVALEPFAYHVKHFWFWQPTRLSVTWQGATLLNFAGWAVVTLLILTFTTPLFIRKQPGSSRASRFHSLTIWLGALLLFATDSAGAGFWWPAGVDAAIAAVTTAFAIRGAKW
jgi:uncharacterized membrane protein